MMKYITFSILFFLFNLSETTAKENDLSTFQLGNEHYENHDFKKAEEIYRQLLSEGYVSDDLHFNLGNTYFKTNEVAKAILHYEKALKINPSNQDARYNLQLANQKTVDKVESIPELFIYRWWKSIYNLFAANHWAKISIICFFSSSFFFFLFLFSPTIQFKKTGFYSFSISLTLAAISWFLAYQQNNYLNTDKHAIIMESTVNIVSAPSDGSSQLFVLHEGTKVRLKEQKENWAKVALPNGNEGWTTINKLETF